MTFSFLQLAHHNIRPATLLIQGTDGDLNVSLADRDMVSLHENGQNTLAEKPPSYYLAPERRQGSTTKGTLEEDVFALGVIFHDILKNTEVDNLNVGKHLKHPAQ